MGSDLSGQMDTDLALQIGAAARRARTALGLSQADIAERAGISGEFYGRIERGRTMPSIETLVELATVLEIGADELLGLGQPRKKKQRPAAQPQEERILLRRLKGAPRSTLLLLNQVLVELEKAEKRGRRQ